MAWNLKIVIVFYIYFNWFQCSLATFLHCFWVLILASSFGWAECISMKFSQKSTSVIYFRIPWIFEMKGDSVHMSHKWKFNWLAGRKLIQSRTVKKSLPTKSPGSLPWVSHFFCRWPCFLCVQVCFWNQVGVFLFFPAIVNRMLFGLVATGLQVI